MSTKIKHIIIKHLTGGKANQVVEFDYSANDTIKFGRATHNDLPFDSEQDGAVSREHGSIQKGETAGTFVIVDNNSLNGVYINGSKITGTAPLMAGDEVMLGAKGPKFVFDLNPRPQMDAATQLIDLGSVAETREMVLEQEAMSDVPAKSGIGQETFERAIVGERKRSQKTLISVVAGVVLVLATLGYTFKDSIIPEPPVIPPPTNTTIIKEGGPNFAALAKENVDKVVLIETGYKFIHTGTGDDIYHIYSKETDPQTKQDVLVPIFIEVEPGLIEPLLGFKKDVEYGAPIALAGARGTGFIVNEDGFIMTNRHVAAPWQSYYTFSGEASRGVLLQNVGGEWKYTGAVDAPINWVPSETKFFGQKPVSGRLLTGVSTYLDVTFAKTDLRTPAKTVRVSNTHDVAMLKIDVPGKLKSVVINESGQVEQGETIALMGYPVVSPTTRIAKVSQDFFNRNTQVQMVPDPSFFDGSIGKVIQGTTLNPNNNGDILHSMMGDYYQLTISESGAGNSGGPVFDKEGKVIGIFTASKLSNDGARITFAVPIKYGLDLMSSQRVIR